MKKLYLLLAVASFSLLLSGQSNQPAKNSDKAAPPDSGDKTRITLDVTRVNMLFTVSDKKGRFVTDLTKDDFEVFENKKPQTIIEFTAETDLPLRLAILIDTSNSIRDRFHFQQEAATAFIDGTVRPRARQGHGGELRYRRRIGDRSDRRHRRAGEGGRKTCAPAAAHRSTTPFSSPAATS